VLVDIHDPICLRVCIDLRKWELVIIREVNAFTRLLYKEGLIDPLLHNQLPMLSMTDLDMKMGREKHVGLSQYRSIHIMIKDARHGMILYVNFVSPFFNVLGHIRPLDVPVGRELVHLRQTNLPQGKVQKGIIIITNHSLTWKVPI